MPTTSTLVLLDYHPLVPFIVRSHQFVSRAASFHQETNEQLHIQIWLPSPKLEPSDIQSQIGITIPPGLVAFGPPRTRKILFQKITLTALFRRWAQHKLLELRTHSQPILYLRTLKLAHALIPFLKKHNIPYIFETHEIFHQTSTKKGLRKIEERVYKNAALVIPISQPLAHDLHSLFSINTSVILPSGHNNTLTGIPPYDPSAPPRLLYIGSLHKWKGLEPFLLATKSLNIPTDIVGDAGGFNRLKEFVSTHSLHHVLLHGQQAPQKLPSFYQPGTICILPLGKEKIAQCYTSPLKLFEYASAGRPIMTGHCPSIATIPGTEKSVKLVENDWHKATSELIAAPLERARLATQAKSFAANYTWQKTARLLLAHPSFSQIHSPSRSH